MASQVEAFEVVISAVADEEPLEQASTRKSDAKSASFLGSTAASVGASGDAQRTASYSAASGENGGDRGNAMLADTLRIAWVESASKELMQTSGALVPQLVLLLVSPSDQRCPRPSVWRAERGQMHDQVRFLHMSFLFGFIVFKVVHL